jgi:hypothetical protein
MPSGGSRQYCGGSQFVARSVAEDTYEITARCVSEHGCHNRHGFEYKYIMQKNAFVKIEFFFRDGASNIFDVSGPD